MNTSFDRVLDDLEAMLAEPTTSTPTKNTVATPTSSRIPSVTTNPAGIVAVRIIVMARSTPEGQTIEESIPVTEVLLNDPVTYYKAEAHVKALETVGLRALKAAAPFKWALETGCLSITNTRTTYQVNGTGGVYQRTISPQLKDEDLALRPIPALSAPSTKIPHEHSIAVVSFETNFQNSVQTQQNYSPISSAVWSPKTITGSIPERSSSTTSSSSNPSEIQRATKRTKTIKTPRNPRSPLIQVNPFVTSWVNKINPDTKFNYSRLESNQDLHTLLQNQKR